MTTRYVDLPAEGTSVGTCVVLPGRQYTPDGPLLFFAAQVALTRGWDDPYLSRQVFDALPGERLLVPGDHVLRVPGDPAAMVASSAASP